MGLDEFFADHIYRTVFAGTFIIGLTAGALGTFAYLRKQSLISDVISHAALPGALIAFLVGASLGLGGNNMAGLVVGAIVVGTLAALFANTISSRSKIRIDSAMAISLTVFFGAGLLIMRFVTNSDLPGKGGVQSYLFGNASVMTQADVLTSLGFGAAALAIMLIFWKEFEVRTFDPLHARVTGVNARLVDLLMYTAIVSATVIGVKAVGLVLMVAFVITPPAAARQWTRTLRGTVALSAAIGALGGGFGAYLSIAIGGLPTGPVIVLVLLGVFLVSLLCAPRRSVIVRAVRRHRARRELVRALAGARESVREAGVPGAREAGAGVS